MINCYQLVSTKKARLFRIWLPAVLVWLALPLLATARFEADSGWNRETGAAPDAKSLYMLSATPARRLIGPAGGRTSFTVANKGSGSMTYRASETTPWLRIISGERGGNRGTVRVSCLANPGAGARTGAITVRAAGRKKTVRVVQGGRRIPLLYVAPDIRRVGIPAGRTTFRVGNKGGGLLRYTAGESASWMKISGGSAGSQGGAITVTFAKNASTRARTGTVVVAATGANGTPARVKIVQAGRRSLNWSISNKSVADPCAEHDNITIAFQGNASSFSIVATHPGFYSPADNSCAANFDNCTAGSDANYYFADPRMWHIDYTAGSLGGWMNAHRDSAFWRPRGFRLAHNGTWIAGATDIHRIDVGRQIAAGPSSFPGYFVLYADGYSRLIPFPPEGQPSVCFGNSVVIGPATPAARPYADIESVDFRTTNQTLLIKYRKGGSALVDFSRVSRVSATLKVDVAYSTSESFCTFRSMYVRDGNSDCDSVVRTDNRGTAHFSPVTECPETTGTGAANWFFYRRFRSIQRMSAPDTRIVY